MNFAEIIRSAFEKKAAGEKSLELRLEKGTADLNLFYYGMDLQENLYGINAFIDGRGFIPFRKITEYLGYAVRVLAPGGMKSSSLYVKLGNGQVMEIDHTAVPDLGLQHYEISFFFEEEKGKPDSKAQTPVLIEIAHKAYGLGFNPMSDLSIENPPFFKDLPWERGNSLTCSSGLSSGTFYEKEARRIVQRLRPYLLPGEEDRLRNFNPALIGDIPPTHKLNGIILQKAAEIKSEGIAKVLDDFPDNLPIHAFLRGEGILILGSDQKTDRAANPHLQYCCDGTKEQMALGLSRIFEVYQKLTQATLADVAVALSQTP